MPTVMTKVYFARCQLLKLPLIELSKFLGLFCNMPITITATNRIK